MTGTFPTKVPERLHDRVYLFELENVLTRMAIDMKPIDPEYSKVVDNHFWELGDGPVKINQK